MNFAAIREEEPLFNDILTALPGCVIAGGFLRDLLLDKPTRDIDIFVERTPTPAEVDALDKLLGCTLFEHVIDTDENYVREGERTSDIKVVYRTDDESANIIVVDNVMAHISEFPDNISRVYFGLSGLVRMSEFIYGHANKIITYRTTAPSARMLKLMSKFPDYTVRMV